MRWGKKTERCDTHQPRSFSDSRGVIELRLLLDSRTASNTRITLKVSHAPRQWTVSTSNPAEWCEGKEKERKLYFYAETTAERRASSIESVATRASIDSDGLAARFAVVDEREHDVCNGTASQRLCDKQGTRKTTNKPQVRP